MKIGIDISQLAYPGTGVAAFLKNFVENLIEQDKENTYVLFYSSMRNRIQDSGFKIQENNPKAKIKTFKLPPTLLDLLWNKLHILPIEAFIGDLDIFISSDWTEPPSKAKKVTILYDLIVYTYPQETAQKIIDTQKRKLQWVKKECDKILCISESTKKDAQSLLGIPDEKLAVIYPGF